MHIAGNHMHISTTSAYIIKPYAYPYFQTHMADLKAKNAFGQMHTEASICLQQEGLRIFSHPDTYDSFEG